MPKTVAIIPFIFDNQGSLSPKKTPIIDLITAIQILI